MKKIILTLVALVMMTATVFAAEATSSGGEIEYKSPRYNFSMNCPKEFRVVQNPSFDTSQFGEMLVFENEGFHVKYGYIITVDAFNDNAVPNFNKDNKKVIEAYINQKKNSGAYDLVEVVELTKDNKGVFARAAKEIEVDENGDGKVDGVAVASIGSAITFFRAPGGRCWSVQVICDNLTDEIMETYKRDVASFKDLNYVPVDKKTEAKNKKLEEKAPKEAEKERLKKEEQQQKAEKEKIKKAKKFKK